MPPPPSDPGRVTVLTRFPISPLASFPSLRRKKPLTTRPSGRWKQTFSFQYVACSDESDRGDFYRFWFRPGGPPSARSRAPAGSSSFSRTQRDAGWSYMWLTMCHDAMRKRGRTCYVAGRLEMSLTLRFTGKQWATTDGTRLLTCSSPLLLPTHNNCKLFKVPGVPGGRRVVQVWATWLTTTLRKKGRTTTTAGLLRRWMNQ